jgi:autotransporter-associated beta strand protein
VGGTGAGGNGALITSTGTGTVGGAMTLSSTANIGGAGTLNIDGVISGATFGITKVGAGTTTLSAANTYTGQTTVGAGTLLLASTGSISGSTLIQIQSGATLNAIAVTGGFQLASGQKLQNTGTFLGNLTAQSGSTYAPGNSPGISTQSANLTLNTGSTFEFELVANTTSGAGINFDQTQFTVANTTDLTIQSGVNASLVFNFTGSTVNWANTFWDADRSWLVFTGADTSTFGGGSGIFSGTQTVGVDSLGNSLTGARGSFAFTNTGPEVFLNYTAIPEPSTYAMLGLGLAALVWLRRKNKNNKA